MADIKYPDGRSMSSKGIKEKGIDRRKSVNRSEEERVHDSAIRKNMGMAFEGDVSKSCDYYRLNDIALIYKRPTPIKIVKMNKDKPGMISEAYFESKSTTDYVGIYKGKYIDFECKETIHDTVPYHMIREQQYDHLRKVIKMGGIAFFLVSFKSFDEVYLLRADKVLSVIDKERHPGFKREFFINNAVLVKRGYTPPYKIIDAINEAFEDEFERQKD